MASIYPQPDPLHPKNGAPPSRLAFDKFELDLRSGELRKEGRKIRLQAQPFQFLALLIENAGEVVTREEVCRALWPEKTFVDFDHGLAVAVNKIREALNDSADDARFIETLPKRGYRFIAPVREVLAPQRANGAGNGTDEATAAGITVLRPSSNQALHAESAGRWWLPAMLAAVMLVVLALWFVGRPHTKSAAKLPAYTQLTNLSNAAYEPAISPDGRMIAFIRSDAGGFPFGGELYTKLLPDGEPVQLTHDGWMKYGPAFSPDGTRVTYTLASYHGWNTQTISALGGEPRLFLSNAAGLTWLDDQHVLFSEIVKGLHMGLVTTSADRSGLRSIYLPEHERGMAHYAHASPDRKWVLVVEMGGTGAWQRCRLLPFDGSSAGTQVGPPGACLAAAWSPDGKWMYFSAYVDGASHLWRQVFPNGDVEQITSGPTEEEGVAVMPDGRSLVSAIGMNDSGIWMHDSHGRHLISSEGYAWLPTFSHDGQRVYYLLRRQSPGSPQELWATDLASGRSEPVVSGFSIDGYDVSPDGKNAVFSTTPRGGTSEIWLAPCDHSSGPRQLTSSGEHRPVFGPDNDLIFEAAEGGKNFAFRMKLDGSQRRKVTDTPIIDIRSVSPDRRWVITGVPVNEVPSTADLAFPLEGGEPQRICPAICMSKWSSDGSRFYVTPLLQNGKATGAAVVIPVPKGKSLPDLPPEGIRSTQDAASVGGKLIDLSLIDPGLGGYNVAPGIAEDTFVYVKTTAHRNLFQIPLQ
ncbi:MAG TPA: winged helix-turn-helix domain-containing protein [Verrucomicrobiae bacterium]|nr:winged helix-turn-helix domain-containing protein [Verrucomicrobiae bacterium]